MLKHPVELSIIVPIYKVEAYLPRCIDSILATHRRPRMTSHLLTVGAQGNNYGMDPICNNEAKARQLMTLLS